MKNKKLIILIVGILLVAAGVLCFFLWPKKSKKEIYIEAVKKSLGIETVENKKDELNSLKGVIKHIVLEIPGEEGNGTFDAYVTEGKAYVLANVSEAGENVKFEGLYKDNKLYFTLKEILEHYYFLDAKVEKNDDSFAALTKIEEIVKDNIAKAIDSDKVVVDDSTKTINSKEYNLKKYSYTFKGEDVYNIIKNTLEDIKNDKTLSGLLFGEGSDVSAKINEGLKELESIKTYGDLITYSVHLKGNDVVTTDIILSITSDVGGKSVPIPVSLSYSKLDGYFEANVSAMGMKLVELVVDKTKGTISLKFNGEEVVTGTVSENKITVSTVGYDLPEINVTIEKNGNKITVKGSFMGEEFNMNITVEDVKEFPNVDVSGAIPFEEATGNDKAILEGLMPAFGSFNEFLPMDESMI